MFINGLPDCNREGVPQKTGLICGCCAKDAQIFTSKNGTVIGSVSVAAYNKPDGTTVWMTVKGFGSMGRVIASASKGDPIIAVGRVEPHDYEGKVYIDFIAEWASVGAQRIDARTAAAPPMNSSGGFEEIQDDRELPF